MSAKRPVKRAKATRSRKRQAEPAWTRDQKLARSQHRLAIATFLLALATFLFERFHM
jgi:hypothetical protein